jgi:hypothetical protein
LADGANSNNIKKQLFAKTGALGGAVNKEAALGKKAGADGGAKDKEKITESNKIKKQK